MAAKKKQMPKKKNGLAKFLTGFLVTLVIALCLAVAAMGYVVWCDYQVVFRDVTVELGVEKLGIREFMTDKAIPKRVGFVSDPNEIDLTKVGETRIILKHGIRNVEVTLTVRDTVAPTAKIETERRLMVTDSFPRAEELVTEIQDKAEVKVYYLEEPQIPENYSDVIATVVVEDTSGNRLQEKCRFRFGGWLRESYSLELGEILTKEMILYYPERDGHLVDEKELWKVRTVGDHTVTVITGKTAASCVVSVRDTTKPELKLKSLQIRPGESVKAEDFVELASDNSGKPQLRIASTMPDTRDQGTYTVEIEAKDESGNVTLGSTTLWISYNRNFPVIRGISEEVVTEKNTAPDYMAGVTVSDDTDKDIGVTVDDSRVDLTTAGTYEVVYSAIDSAGNHTKSERRVVVKPDGEDLLALAKTILEDVEKTPEAIRDYVHDTVAYREYWNGGDPAWHGLSEKNGNSLVHAHTLKTLLEAAGFEAQVIWVKNETHHWVIVKTGEGWRHIDSTPSSQHERIGLATDEVRKQNLNGRDWDRSQWPACE